MELQFKAKVFIFVCVGSAIFFLMYVSQLGMPKRFEPVKLYFERKSSTCNATAEQGTKPTLLLVYTTFFGEKEWVPRVEKCPRRSPCNISGFEVIYDKQRFSESDVVLFHARDMTDVGELNKLLKRKPCSQRWVYFLMESPNATPDTGRLNGFFNLTWTFRSDSDIWAPYGTYYTKTSSEISAAMNFSLQDFSQGKSKLVSWMVSNCGPALRKEFVHQLQKYVQVDVFGSCSGEFGGSKNCPKGDSCRSTMQQYKFYLAFENALCEDYITEKYWRHLGEENVIPVVMGGANYSKLAIPGSYINVMDFKTVKELAKYLQYLDKNNTAYNEYFTWRRKYEKLSRPLLCELCLAMGMGTTPQPKVYNNLNEYWFGQGKCNQKDQSVRNMFQS